MGISYFDVWKKRMNNNGGDIIQSRLNTSKDFFNRNFKDDPSYKLATLKKKDTNTVDSNLDTRIVNFDTDVYKKKMYVRPDTNIEAGDYIIYPNKTYLVLSVEDNLISPYAHATFCNYILKWMIDGVLYSMPAIVTNNTKYTLGIKNQSSFTEADGMFGAIISYNDIAKKIPLGKRFIVNGQAWEATQLDHSSTPNVLSILLGESSKSTEYDDMENEIADAFLRNYTISLNSTSESITETATYQLNPIVADNGVPVLSPIITYKSSDETIATVDSKGLVNALKVGNCKINCSIGNASADLSLTVTAKTITPVISYSCDWSTGKTSSGVSLKTYMSSTATCKETIDGVVNSALIVNYSLDSVGSTLLSTGAITITRKSNVDFLIKNVSVSTSKRFAITFTNSTDNSMISNQTVSLIGM